MIRDYRFTTPDSGYRVGGLDGLTGGKPRAVKPSNQPLTGRPRQLPGSNYRGRAARVLAPGQMVPHRYDARRAGGYIPGAPGVFGRFHYAAQ